MFRQRFDSAVAILFGVALAIAMQGYQFGKSNHTVYLLDAMRHAEPQLLRNDWFETQTLQYHAVFGFLTRWLYELHVIEPAFLAGYMLLVVLMHAAWWKIVRALGGGVAAFLMSEVFFHISAGGTAPGMYQFLQDAAFLPSNIAAVAMLWGVYLWLVDRRAGSALLFGLSGVFHLNFALIAPAIWVALALWARLGDRRKLNLTEILAAIAMAEICLINLLPAAVATLRHGQNGIPLAEFVELFVKLRHPHHQDPLSWPALLWISFLWPIPLAWSYAAEHIDDEPVKQAWRMCLLIAALLIISFVGSGIWYWSETLIQMSLWRFGLIVKLSSCIGAAMWIEQRVRQRRQVIAAAAMIAGGAMIVACTLRGPFLGLFKMPEDDPLYASVCDWVRDNTPVDAIFLVPPDEQEFRLRARRAIVINFKGVPQMSVEMGPWRDRMKAVIHVSDLRSLPTPLPRTLQAIREAYDRQPESYLTQVAREYGARYVITRQPRDLPLVHAWGSDGDGRYFLYDLARR